MPCWPRWCESRRRNSDSALDRLIAAGLLFRHGVPPHATYLFKHALVQDVAYGTLLREPRRTLHARIAETLESQFPEIAQSQPELLARHYTKAELIEKAAAPVGQGGAAFTGALGAGRSRGAAQPGAGANRDPALYCRPAARADRFKVALLNTLMHVKGYGAPETKAAVAQVRALIEQAEAARRDSR